MVAGAIGRGTGTTQVNYHQQPTRAGGNAAQQPARNPGYTTQQAAPVSYNSAAQPAFSTQPAYTTTTPQAKPAANQPPLPAQPSTPKPQVAPVVKTPIQPKVEPVTPQDTPTMEAQENGEEQMSKSDKIPFWRKKAAGGVAPPKLSNKVRKARHNAKLRRVLNPKNAITFLNELKPGGIKFVVKEEPGWGYSASVDIDGKTFSGHGMSVSKAKMHASELALKHLLLEQLAKSALAPVPNPVKEEDKEGDDEMETEEQTTEDGEAKPKRPKRAPPPEDEVPWGSLAAFALHKLFNEWQSEGGEGMSMGMSMPEKFAADMSEEAYYSQRAPEYFPRRFAGPGPYSRPAGRGRGFGGPGPFPRGGPHPSFSMPRRPLPAAATFLQGGTRGLPGISVGNVQPMKKIPEDAGQRHPVMLLNQLKPDVVYNEAREGTPPNTVFVISVNIDGKEYVGRGRNKKDAKKNAAVSALAPLGIRFQEEVK